MEFYMFTLPNGIRCIHKRVKSPAAHCALTIGAGSRDELSREYGMAHMAEHMLFKGTVRRRAHHINCRLENLGGELNAYTTKEETVVHATTLKADFDKAAELISDIVFDSVFPEKEMQKEKEIVLDEINSYKDSPSERIFDQFEDLLFEGMSLGHNILGTRSSVGRSSPQLLKAFTGRVYNTDQMIFSAVGDMTGETFERIARRRFGDRPAVLRSFERDEANVYSAFDKSVKHNTFQAHCIIGNRAYGFDDPRRTTLSLLVNILGGPAANSLLSMVIREKHGLAYNIEAGFTPFTGTGIATIYFSCDHDNADRCIELIKRQIAKLQNEQLGSRQLSTAKKQVIGQLAISMENNEASMHSAAKSLLTYDHVEDMASIYRRISEITAADIVETARDIFGNTSTLLYR